MGLFNWFGEPEHHVFDYRPRYYDKEKEERRQRFSKVDGSEEYEPGVYLRGSFRNGNYSRERGHANKVQNIIGIIGLILVVTVLFFIAKFYTLL